MFNKDTKNINKIRNKTICEEMMNILLH